MVTNLCNPIIFEFEVSSSKVWNGLKDRYAFNSVQRLELLCYIVKIINY